MCGRISLAEGDFYCELVYFLTTRIFRALIFSAVLMLYDLYTFSYTIPHHIYFLIFVLFVESFYHIGDNKDKYLYLIYKYSLILFVHLYCYSEYFFS